MTSATPVPGAERGVVLRARVFTRAMGVTCAVVGGFFIVGGVVATAAGQGVDNLVNFAAGLVFFFVGLDLWRARVLAAADGVRVERLFRKRFIPRNEIAGVELGAASGMYIAGQRTVVIRTDAGGVPLLVLSRYATASGEQVLRQQQAALLTALGEPTPEPRL